MQSTREKKLVKLPKNNKWSTPYEPMFSNVCSILGSQTASHVRDRLTVCRDASKFKLANAVIKTRDDLGMSQKAQPPQSVPDLEIPV